MNKQHPLLILLLLAFITIPAHLQICSLSTNSNDLLQSGTHVVSNAYTNNILRREHSYTFAVNFVVPASGLQVAASASSFNVTANNGMDFSIWGGQGQTANTGLIIVLNNEDSSWTSIRVSYLASARSDFVLGFFSAGTYFLQNSSPNGVVTYPYTIPGWSAQSRQFNVFVEISGVKTYSTSVRVHIATVSLNSISGMITLTLNLVGSPPIESVLITFVAFDTSSALRYSTFVASQGSSMPYQLIGMDTVQSGSAIYAGNGFSSNSQSGISCIGSRCSSTCISSQACISVNGVIQNNKCFLCLTGQVVQNEQCVTPSQTCGANQYRNNFNQCVCIPGYELVNQACVLVCGTNQYRNNFNQCVCNPGYTMVNGICTQVNPSCGANAYRNNFNQCVCNPGYTMVNGICTQVNPSCGANAYRNNFNQCVCNPGFTMVNGLCVSTTPTCGTNQYRNTATNQCACIQGYSMVNGVCYLNCNTNAVIMNNQCVCLPGYTYSSTFNQCTSQSTITCKTNFVVVNNQCVCPSGFGMIETDCVVCPPNSYVDQTGKCACNPGFTLNVTSRICAVSCFANAYRNAFGQCACNNGYYRQGNQCIPQGTCQNGLVWNSSHCVCPAGQVMDSITSQCTYCNTLGRTVSNNQCVCSPNYYPTQTGCSPCLANRHYDSAQGRCVCDTNYVENNGVCVLVVNCPTGSYWSAAVGRCVCNAQFQYVINGYCQPCTSNSHYDSAQGKCVCDTNYNMDSNGACTKTCVNGTWTGSACVCWSGYFIIAGVCQPCDANSQYSNTAFTCVCNDGWFGTYSQCSKCDATCKTCTGPATNQCTTCPTGTPANGFCTTTCPAGSYTGASNQCLACTANCILCYAASSCATCATGYSAISTNTGGSIATTCELPASGVTHAITLRSAVLGSLKIYQGVALNLMPSAILTAGCTICNDLLEVNVNSQFTSISVTVEYITTQKYAFMIIFDFPSATSVPTFEFTVSIKTAHASYFTSQDMAQTLTSSFNSNTFDSTTVANAFTAATPSARSFGPSTLGLSRASFSRTPTTPQWVIDKIFN